MRTVAKAAPLCREVCNIYPSQARAAQGFTIGLLIGALWVLRYG